MPVASLIIGVDLAPIKPIRGVKTFINDITTQVCDQVWVMLLHIAAHAATRHINSMQSCGQQPSPNARPC